MKSFPTLAIEKGLWSQGRTVIGVDEVGRGCLAGPLYVCASYFKPTTQDTFISYLESLGINDSKKLTAIQRSSLYKLLQREQFHFSIGIVTPEIIDINGLTKAVEIAVIQAIQPLLQDVDQTRLMILYDGSLSHPFSEIPYQTIIKGDSISLTIAASSIMAKVERDGYMDLLAQEFPVYNWDSNKGYGTLDHRTAIKNIGPSLHHRKLFLRKLTQSTILSTNE